MPTATTFKLFLSTVFLISIFSHSDIFDLEQQSKQNQETETVSNLGGESLGGGDSFKRKTGVLPFVGKVFTQIVKFTGGLAFHKQKSVFFVDTAKVYRDNQALQFAYQAISRRHHEGEMLTIAFDYLESKNDPRVVKLKELLSSLKFIKDKDIPDIDDDGLAKEDVPAGMVKINSQPKIEFHGKYDMKKTIARIHIALNEIC